MSTAKVESLQMQVLIGKWDITEYVLSGSVSKSLGQPLGQWTLRCRPILDSGRAFDTNQIYPMDYVEIRVGRPAPGEKIPILTRGFVSAIDIDDGVTQDLDGSPQRSITISGHDLTKAIVGKVLRNTVAETVASQNSIDRDTDLLSLENFVLQRAHDKTNLGLSEFVNNIMAYVFYDSVVGMQLVNNFNFVVKTNLPKQYSSAQPLDLLNIETVATIRAFTGNLWSYLQSYCPKPVIEMFVEDNEEESTFNVRWAPYRTIFDWSSRKLPEKFLHSGAKANAFPARGFLTNSHIRGSWLEDESEIKKTLISINEIMNIRVRRHDNDRHTYFICMYKNWSRNGPNGASVAPSAANGWKNAQFYANRNADPASRLTSDRYENYGINPYYDHAGIIRFGLKAFQFNAPFSPFRISSASDNTIAAKAVTLTELYASINFWAIQAFMGIDTLYSGMIVMRGCPNIKIGQELFIDRDKNSSYQYKDVTLSTEYPNEITEQYYVESVEHVWQVFPNPQFTTRLGVTRGVNIGKISAPFTAGGSTFTAKTDRTDLYTFSPEQLSNFSQSKLNSNLQSTLRPPDFKPSTTPAPTTGGGTQATGSAALSPFTASAPNQIQRTVSTFFAAKPENQEARIIRGVVLHHTGGDKPVACHNAGSWHFLIDRDGTLYKDVAVQDVAFHAENTNKWRPSWVARTCSWVDCSDINTCSIGIEMVSPGTGTATFTSKQYECLKYLAHDIQQQYGSLWWVGHGEIQPDRHDPWKFDWDDFFTPKDANNGRKWK